MFCLFCKIEFYFTTLAKETLQIEIEQWLNNFPMDSNDQLETSRAVACSSSDFPQIECPDMPLDDLYVAQYIATAETNMQKQKEKDLEEIREKVQFLCDVCILVYEGRSVSKEVVVEKNLEAKYHNPVLKLNFCSDCYEGIFEVETWTSCIIDSKA